MTRRNRKFDIGFMRNRISFYSQEAVMNAHGSTMSYNLLITRFASKEINNQSQFYAIIAGASFTNQTVLFFTRSHPTFFPKKDMFVKNENDGFGIKFCPHNLWKIRNHSIELFVRNWKLVLYLFYNGKIKIQY